MDSAFPAASRSRKNWAAPSTTDAVRINDLIGLIPVPRGHETARLRHPQRRQVPAWISFFDHDRRTYRQEQLFTR